MSATKADSLRPTHLSGANVACPVCGASFLKRRSWSQFCSDKCRKAYHKNTRKAGVDFSVRKAFEQIQSDLTAIKAHIGLTK